MPKITTYQTEKGVSYEGQAMTTELLNLNQNEKRKRLMNYFADTAYIHVKKDVEELSHEEAQTRWALVKENFRGVCFRAGVGSRRVRDSWTSMMRKMVLLRDKAAKEAEG